MNESTLSTSVLISLATLIASAYGSADSIGPNGTVGPEDYDIWKSNFGTSLAAADGNGNGVVDAADYTVWRNNLGTVLGSGSLASVPEPASAAYVAVALVGLVTLRRGAVCRSPKSTGRLASSRA